MTSLQNEGINVFEQKEGSIHVSEYDHSRYWSKDKIAVVTGSNRGIGFEVARKLSNQGLIVIMACRDKVKGEKALKDMIKGSSSRNLNIVFHILDIADKRSIAGFVEWLQKTYGYLDVLVNNAGVAFKKDTMDDSVDYAETVLKTNYYGTKYLTDSLLPLFRRSLYSARVLFLSSRLGSFDKMQNEEYRRMLNNIQELKEPDLDRMLERFMEEVKNGTWKSGGWPQNWTDYAVSKMALNAYCCILKGKIEKEERKIKVNCFCPGFTKTDMTNGIGKYTAREAGVTAASIVLLPPSKLPTAKFFHVNRQMPFSKL